MITVDILSPTGGRNGGIENVIKLWKQNLGQEYKVRVIHMSPGMKYLDGFDEIYAFDECNEPDIKEKLTHYARNYAGFINLYGAPQICVATNWPAMCLVADAVRKSQGLSFKVISWVHSGIMEYKKAGLGGCEEMLCADGHICISSANADAIMAAADEYGLEAVTYTVGNPVVMQEFVEDPGETNTICYVGRLQEVKRVDIILEALYRAKHKWKLKIVGSGEEEEELKAICAYLKQEEQVEFLGWQDNPWECCKDCMALVAASEYEGFMLTGAEALSLGMTVISTPVDGLVDYLRPGVNGYLFKQEDA